MISQKSNPKTKIQRLVVGLFGPQVKAKGVLHVDKSAVSAFCNSVNLGVVLLAELIVLEVALDTARSGRLGENGVTTLDSPGDKSLGQGVSRALSNLVQGLVLGDLLSSSGDLVLGSEGRVGNEENVLGLAVVEELLVGEEGVDLDLVGSGFDGGEGQKLLETGDSPVGDSDGTCLSAALESLHGAPGGLGVLGELVVDHVLRGS